MDWVFAPPGNVSTFQQKLEYINNLTDVGFGPVFGTLLLIVITGVLFMMSKSFGVERGAGVSFFIGAILAVFLRIMGLINNTVLTVSVLLGFLGLFLLIKEAGNYE